MPAHVLHPRPSRILGPLRPRSPGRNPEDALKNAFGWCQYDGHGPGDELLGDSLTTLDLGPGRGNAVAALATKGVVATGVDLSPVQVDAARSRWAHLPNAHFEQADVLDFLTTTDQRWDAIYSIWGAAWFTDPTALLPAVLQRLTPAAGWCSPTHPTFPAPPPPHSACGQRATPDR